MPSTSNMPNLTELAFKKMGGYTDKEIYESVTDLIERGAKTRPAIRAVFDVMGKKCSESDVKKYEHKLWRDNKKNEA